MKMSFAYALIFAAVAFCGGCISFEYNGKCEAPAADDPVLVRNAAEIKRKYTVLGQAQVSGNYQDVSRDRMTAKLIAKAKARGADAVIIVDELVIPKSHGSVNSGKNSFSTTFDADDESRTWSQLSKDVNQDFAPGSKENIEIGADVYIRQIKADFVKFDK